MSELFPKYTLQKVNPAFTGWPFIEMYFCISFMLCMLPFANRPIDVKTNVRIYSIQYKVFTVSYHCFNMPDVL